MEETSCYPASIMPRGDYVFALDVDALNEQLQSVYMVRRLEGQPYHMLGEEKVLDDEAIPEDVIDWSVCLLGGKFQVEDLRWRQFGEGASPWKGEDVKLEDFEGYYELKDNMTPLYLAMGKFHNVYVPYQRNFGSVQDVLRYHEKTGELSNQEIEGWDKVSSLECQEHVTVVHAPNKLNYWHMMIQVRPLDMEAPIDRNKKGALKRNVRAALHLYISNTVTLEHPSFEMLPDWLYKRT